jgi:hypothetical protein
MWWLYIEKATLVSLSPVEIESVVVTPASDAQGAEVILYDGESARDPKIIKVKSSSTSSTQLSFSPPLKTNRGLYIDCQSGRDIVLVHYQLLEE